MDAANTFDWGVDLYWLPLGVRGRCVRWSGKTFEAVAAITAHRSRLDLYHSFLEVRAPEGRFVIEMGPAFDDLPSERGVVATGAVGFAWGAVLPILRYEVRCWPHGISAFEFAVDSPMRLTTDGYLASTVLRLVGDVPAPVWGRDELGVGEMWTSNSVTSWLLARAGIVNSIQPPVGGRAPGWDAGLAVAARGAGPRASRRSRSRRSSSSVSWPQATPSNRRPALSARDFRLGTMATLDD